MNNCSKNSTFKPFNATFYKYTGYLYYHRVNKK